MNNRPNIAIVLLVLSLLALLFPACTGSLEPTETKYATRALKIHDPNWEWFAVVNQSTGKAIADFSESSGAGPEAKIDAVIVWPESAMPIAIHSYDDAENVGQQRYIVLVGDDIAPIALSYSVDPDTKAVSNVVLRTSIDDSASSFYFDFNNDGTPDVRKIDEPKGLAIFIDDCWVPVKYTGDTKLITTLREEAVELTESARKARFVDGKWTVVEE